MANRPRARGSGDQGSLACMVLLVLLEAPTVRERPLQCGSWRASWFLESMEEKILRIRLKESGKTCKTSPNAEYAVSGVLTIRVEYHCTAKRELTDHVSVCACEHVNLFTFSNNASSTVNKRVLGWIQSSGVRKECFFPENFSFNKETKKFWPRDSCATESCLSADRDRAARGSWVKTT